MLIDLWNIKITAIKVENEPKINFVAPSAFRLVSHRMKMIACVIANWRVLTDEQEAHQKLWCVLKVSFGVNVSRSCDSKVSERRKFSHQFLKSSSHQNISRQQHVKLHASISHITLSHTLLPSSRRSISHSSNFGFNIFIHILFRSQWR